MKILLITGDHPRHLYLNKKIIELGYPTKLILINRENIIPKIPKKLINIDKRNMKMHFKDRIMSEKKYFSDLKIKDITSKIEYIRCKSSDLHHNKNKLFVKKFSPNIAIVFGTPFIKDPLLSILPKDTINIHNGLSPYYKGTATNFWPFYFLEPQYVGITIHKISKEIDSGNILHQSLPKLSYGDKIHDVASKSLIKVCEDLRKLIVLKNKKRWIYFPQKNMGKLFLNKDFKPQHLRIVYNYFENKIVDMYLDRKLLKNKPKIIKAI